MDADIKDSPFTIEKIAIGNEMIAHYMGGIYYGDNPQLTPYWRFPNGDIKAKLEYHIHFNKIMKVVKKINQENPVIFEFSISLSPVAKLMWVPHKGEHKYFHSEQAFEPTEIQVIWDVVVQFLKWHKQFKP